MAARMAPYIFAAKAKIIDDLEEQFLVKIKQFTSEAKATMHAASGETAIECFELTLVFLSQLLPNLPKLKPKPEDSEDVTAKLRKDLKKLDEAQQTLSQKLADVETQAEMFTEKVKNDLDRLSKRSHSNAVQLLGLRKLQRIFRTKTSKTRTVPTQHWPAQIFSQRKTFSVQIAKDAMKPCIYDMKLLPGGLVLLGDVANSCVKLFNTQGNPIQRLDLNWQPLCLTVMDSQSPSGWNVAVTLSCKSLIAMIHVEQNKLTFEKYIPTSQPCCSIAAVDPKTLAVAYSGSTGVDFIDLSGKILRRLNSSIDPNYMVATQDRCLVMSNSDDSIAKLKPSDGTFVYNHKVGQVQNHWSISSHIDGTCVVTCLDSRTLHLVSSKGGWIKELWGHPDGADKDDQLRCVSLLNNECLACTEKGIVFVIYVS